MVKAELSGFKTATTQPITLEAKQIARLDFKMEVGALEDTVEVTAAAPVLQTESATVGEVISGNTVQSLPLNGRNTGQLALLLPGTVTYNPRGFTNIGSVNMNRPFVNGNREQTNNFIVDGLDVNETIDNRVAYQPSPDALAEISVETNNYAADTGNVGGRRHQQRHQVGRATSSAATCSSSTGTATSTRTPGRTTAPARPRQERKQHIFGATLGGPIIKDKLFFFADYQGSRQDAPGLQHRVGGARGLAPRRPVEHHHRRSAIPRTGLPFPGNQIPLDRISPTARAILNDTANYPLPNRTVPGGVTGNFVGETLFTIRAHQGDLRLDWNASAERQALRAASRSPPTRTSATSSPSRWSSPTRNDQPFYNVGVNWNRVFGPVADQRGAGRLQPHHRRLGDLRLGGRRRRQRAATASRAASPSPA